MYDINLVCATMIFPSTLCMQQKIMLQFFLTTFSSRYQFCVIEFWLFLMDRDLSPGRITVYCRLDFYVLSLGKITFVNHLHNFLSFTIRSERCFEKIEIQISYLIVLQI